MLAARASEGCGVGARRPEAIQISDKPTLECFPSLAVTGVGPKTRRGICAGAAYQPARRRPFRRLGNNGEKDAKLIRCIGQRCGRKSVAFALAALLSSSALIGPAMAMPNGLVATPSGSRLEEVPDGAADVPVLRAAILGAPVCAAVCVPIRAAVGTAVDVIPRQGATPPPRSGESAHAHDWRRVPLAGERL